MIIIQGVFGLIWAIGLVAAGAVQLIGKIFVEFGRMTINNLKKD